MSWSFSVDCAARYTRRESDLTSQNRGAVGQNPVVYSGKADAPTLILSSSPGTTSGMWRPQFDALASRFRVIAYDHRGHGESPVPEGPYSLDDRGRDALRLMELAGSIPGARYSEVAAAHLANVEQPDQVTALLAEHFG